MCGDGGGSIDLSKTNTSKARPIESLCISFSVVTALGAEFFRSAHREE